MKRILSVVLCLFIFLLTFGCSNSAEADLRSGNYFAVGDYDYKYTTPYVFLDTAKNEFYFSLSFLHSHAERGTYKVQGRELIVTTQNETFTFEIKDKETLILIDSGNDEYFKNLVKTQFVFCEDIE